VTAILLLLIVSLGLLRYRGSRGGTKKLRSIDTVITDTRVKTPFRNGVAIGCYNYYTEDITTTTTTTTISTSSTATVNSSTTTTRHSALRSFSTHTTLPVNVAHRPDVLNLEQSYPPSLYVLNIASLAKPYALESLIADIQSTDSTLVIITESHLKKKHATSTFLIRSYELFRRDRLARRGGGVAIYAKSSISPTEWIYYKNNSDFELIWVKLEVGGRMVLVGGIYNPPKAIYEENKLIEYIEECVIHISSTFANPLILLSGDFNQLKDETVVAVTGLYSIVNQPTRQSSYLDRIFVSEPVYDNVKVIKSVTRSDHLAIIAFAGIGDLPPPQSCNKDNLQEEVSWTIRQLFRTFHSSPSSGDGEIYSRQL
jgi:hypothetical protein